MIRPNAYTCLLTVATLAMLASVPTAAATSVAPDRAVRALPAAASAPDRIDQLLRSMLARREFLGAALVARGNRVLLARGYGYADRAARRPNSALTQFRITGLTSLVTRAAAYRLRDRSQLDLNAPVCSFISRCRRDWAWVTVGAVLRREARLPNVRRLRMQTREPPSIAEAVAWLVTQPLPAQRGPEAGDTGGVAAGDVILARLIERASGLSWQQYIQRHFFAPSGMTSTFPDEGVSPNRRAVGYMLPSFRRGKDVQFTSPDPAQGLWSTVGDVYRFERALFAGRLLSKSSREALFGADPDFAQGMHAYDSAISRVTDGFYQLLERHAEQRIVVVLLTNGRKPQYLFYEIANQLATIAAGKTTAQPVKLPTGDLIAYLTSSAGIEAATLDGAQRFPIGSQFGGRPVALGWSPSGDHLAFIRCRASTCRTYVIGADGRGERSVGDGRFADWMPDGGGLIMLIARPGDSQFQGRVVAVSLAGGSREIGGGATAIAAAISADGRWLLYTTPIHGARVDHSRGRNWLMLRDLETKQTRRVWSRPGFYQIRSGAWSSSANTFAFTRRERLGALDGAVYVMSVDGSPREIATGGNWGATWAPDGRRLVFNLGIGCQARIVSIDGSTAPSTLPFRACFVAWRPAAS